MVTEDGGLPRRSVSAGGADFSMAQWRSLTRRVTLFTLVFFLLSIWGLEVYLSRMLQADTQRSLGDQQFSTVSLFARQVDRELAARLLAVQRTAARISTQALANPASMQEGLQRPPILPVLFNRGAFVVSVDGVVIGDTVEGGGRVGSTVMANADIAAVLNGAPARVAKPTLNASRHAAQIFIVAPIKDGTAKVAGAVVGVVDLALPNFISEITDVTLGKSGHYLLVAQDERLVIQTRDVSRTMTALPPLGANPNIDKFIAGYEGSDVFTSSRGIEVLTSAKGLSVARLLIVASLPTQEAFAPIHALQWRMTIATILLSILSGALTWWMLRRQLKPLLSAIEQRESALQESEVRYRSMVEWTPEAIVVHRQLRVIYANPAAAQMFGAQSDKDLVGRALLDFIHPDFHFVANERLKRLTEQGGSVPVVEMKTLRLDGSAVDLEVKSSVIIFDGEPAVFAVARDVSERKRVSEQLRCSHERLQLVASVTNDAIWDWDLKTDAVQWNEGYQSLFGYAPDAMDTAESSCTRFIHADDLDRVMEGVGAAIARGDTEWSDEYRFVRRDGSCADVFDRALILYNEEGVAIRMIGAMQDITERKRSKTELVESYLHTQTILDNMVDGVITINAQGIVESFNKAAGGIFGYTPDEVIGGNVSRLMPEPHRGQHDEYMARFARTGEMRVINIQREVEAVRSDGTPVSISLSVSQISRAGQVIFIGLVRDVTQHRLDVEEIRRLAFFDPLTGLANRRLLFDRLQQALMTTGRTEQHGALMLLDLDHFKQLNDTQGHDVGDLLLQQVAQRLQDSVREGDSVARLGGDEFVVLLEGLSADTNEAATQAELVAYKILGALGHSYILRKHVYASTPSIGIVVFKKDDESMDDLLKKADVAMYQAKSAGRNTARFFDPAMQAAVAAHIELGKDLRRGLLDREFVLHYQIQVDASGATTGVEALVRWRHPMRGIVSPAQFIPLAEESGLILPLGQWVMEEACTQLLAWAKDLSKANWTMAVNVSASQLAQGDFVSSVSKVLSKTGANPYLLKLELTESMLAEDVDAVVVKMHALRQLGVRFSLDDFGTGYSSLSYLKRLPLDQLKIDQSFVRDLLTDPNDAVIARTIVALGHSLGLKVIAEGVETAGQRDFLASMGCDDYQGFHFGRPMPAAVFSAPT